MQTRATSLESHANLPQTYRKSITVLDTTIWNINFEIETLSSAAINANIAIGTYSKISISK